MNARITQNQEKNQKLKKVQEDQENMSKIPPISLNAQILTLFSRFLGPFVLFKIFVLVYVNRAIILNTMSLCFMTKKYFCPT